MKTSEMIAMLEDNPKLRFTTCNNGIKVGLNRYGSLVYLYPDDQIVELTRYVMENTEWEIAREPVPVWEAIKAWTEGKEVVAHIRKDNHTGSCFCLTPMFHEKNEIPIRFLSRGEWYINE